MTERGRPKAELVLSDDERETLERWARWPKSAQALACAVASCSSAPATRPFARCRVAFRYPKRRCRSGGDGSSRTAWRDSTTSRALGAALDHRR
jgi:hypothetical protein